MVLTIGGKEKTRMSRLIDADALMEVLGMAIECKNCKSYDGSIGCMCDPQFVWACEAINDAPTVSPKTGRWIAHDSSIKDVPTEACSECGTWSYGWNMPYCPNCGARMMDEVENG